MNYPLCLNVKALSHPDEGMGISNKNNSSSQQVYWDLEAGW